MPPLRVRGVAGLCGKPALFHGMTVRKDSGRGGPLGTSWALVIRLFILGWLLARRGRPRRSPSGSELGEGLLCRFVCFCSMAFTGPACE